MIMVVSAPIEFRIPISPRSSFYRRVNFSCAALKRPPRAYAETRETRVRVVVGDDAVLELEPVWAENRWSSQYNVDGMECLPGFSLTITISVPRIFATRVNRLPQSLVGELARSQRIITWSDCSRECGASAI